jgi:hypothetical protein
MHDLFRPINLVNTFGVLVLLLSLDVVGVNLNKNFFKLSKVFRPAFWLFGLGVWGFWLFIGHFWLPFMWQWTITPVLFLQSFFEKITRFRMSQVFGYWFQ